MATQEERRNATRAAIIAAAHAAFEAHGSPDVPLDEIADDAGVTKSTILYHFTSRTRLLAAVAAALFVEIEERADAPTTSDYIRALLTEQAKPVGRVLFTIGDELLRTGQLGEIDPYRYLCTKLIDLGATEPVITTAGAVMQFARQLAFGLADVSEIDDMLAALDL